MDLTAGANTAIPTTAIKLTLQIFGAELSDLDFSAYILSSQTEKVRTDDDMIFYGQQKNQAGTVSILQINSHTAEFTLKLASISSDIGKIAICATVAKEKCNFSSIGYLKLKIVDHNTIIATSKIDGQNRLEVALIIGQFYRHQHNWKFRLVAQGFHGGLKPLAEHFGVEISDDTPENTDESEFYKLLDHKLADGELTERDIKNLQNYCKYNKLNIDHLLKRVEAKINSFLYYTLAAVASDGIVDNDEQILIDNLIRFFKPQQHIIDEIQSTINRVNLIAKIKAGDIQAIEKDTLITRNTEVIWFEQSSVSMYDNRQGMILGTVYVTSERIIFKASKSLDIPIQGILSLELNAATVLITSSSPKKSCDFISQDAAILEAYIDQTIKRFHRKLDLNQSTRNTRVIPQRVKSQVWTRYQGQCVQCSSSSYLEFDHIIPFSKGGSNSENNIQLLCRACNLAKSDQI